MKTRDFMKAYSEIIARKYREGSPIMASIWDMVDYTRQSYDAVTIAGKRCADKGYVVIKFLPAVCVSGLADTYCYMPPRHEERYMTMNEFLDVCETVLASRDCKDGDPPCVTDHEIRAVTGYCYETIWKAGDRCFLNGRLSSRDRTCKRVNGIGNITWIYQLKQK